MKAQDILAALAGAGAKAATTVSTLSVIAGLAYLGDCRINSKSEGSIDRCWMTALPIMGIGVGVRGGFAIGYNTLNPSLRRPEGEQSVSGDDRGR